MPHMWNNRRSLLLQCLHEVAFGFEWGSLQYDSENAKNLTTRAILRVTHHIRRNPQRRSLNAVDGALYRSSLRLQAPLEFLDPDTKAHKNGKYIAHQIQAQGGAPFLQMPTEAMECRNLARIPFKMEKLLLVSIYPTDVYNRGGDYVWQLERDYEVDLRRGYGTTTKKLILQFKVKFTIATVRLNHRDMAPKQPTPRSIMKASDGNVKAMPESISSTACVACVGCCQ
ncbi:hypothetical protein B0H19DRAFT_1294925 [Mycena capillaripes]|nr:hypothetical protein B0H19DRAFT_1294925 [Mycena capillaripes]